MPRDLKNRAIIITGASAGIGAATAMACANAGMKVVLAARREERLIELAQQINREGGAALAVACDVQSDEQVQQMIDQSLSEFGRVDAIFANAGHAVFGPVMQTPEKMMRDQFETNFWGVVRTIRCALPVIEETANRHGTRGHVLACSSTISKISLPMYGYYCATKAALDSVAGALRAELYDRPIDVTTVHPVGTRTEFFDVARCVSPNGSTGQSNTPAALTHTPERVARNVVNCLRRPRAEVWPNTAVRFGIAIATALPFLAAWSMKKMARDRFAEQIASCRNTQS